MTQREPARLAREVEAYPALPPGDGDRFSGYAVLGVPFRSGHVLALRRWTASSVGGPLTSVWHRDPGGRWVLYGSARSEGLCNHYFGAEFERVRIAPIALHWEDGHRLRITTSDDGALDWTIELKATTTTRIFSAIGAALPRALWDSGPVLAGIGRVAGAALRAGTVRLAGRTPSGHRFAASPLRIWEVENGRAVVEGQDLGPLGPLAHQARMADFYVPQRGILAIGHMRMAAVP